MASAVNTRTHFKENLVLEVLVTLCTKAPNFLIVWEGKEDHCEFRKTARES